MPISERPWGNVSEADYADGAAFCRASLIDLNPPGEEKTKALCKLPVFEPGGSLNRSAVHSAAAVLAGARGGVDAPPAKKAAAARRLMSLYRELDDEPPASLRRMTG